jgi:hypothetical protein
MTVETTTNVVEYTGNGAADTFDFPFRVLDADHLIVSRLLADDDSLDHVYTQSEYTVTGIGDEDGTVQLDDGALAATYKVRLERIVPITQEADLVNQGGFYPQTIENQLDLMVMAIQQLENGDSATAAATNAKMEAIYARNEAQGARDEAEAAAVVATSEASRAESEADRAETAAAAAALSAADIFPSTAAGVAAKADGEYFYVQDADGNLQLWRDVAGVATIQDFVLMSADNVTAALEEHRRYTGPFIVDVADEYMRSIVEDIYVEGGDAGHEYILNMETLNIGGGNGRVRFTVRDATLGLNMCTIVVIDTQAAINATTVPTLLLFQADLAGYSGITATIWVNWSAITNWAYALSAYTLYTESGIRNDHVYTPTRMREFERRAEPKLRLTVGAGATSDTHFNTVQDAFDSLYIPGISVTRSTYPNSYICTFSNQVMIEVIDDAYEEEILPTVFFAIRQSKIVFPPFCTLRLRQDTLLWMDDGIGTAPTFEGPFPFRVEGGQLEGRGPGYVFHIDNNNGRALRSTVAGDKDVLRYPMMSVFEDVTFLPSTDQSTWTLGCGLSNGHSIIGRRCRVVGPGGLAKPFLGVHTSVATTDPGLVEWTDGYMNDGDLPGSSAIQLLKSNAMDVQHTLNIKGSEMTLVTHGNTAGGADGWRRAGKIDSDITVAPAMDA